MAAGSMDSQQPRQACAQRRRSRSRVISRLCSAFRELRVANGCMQAHRGASTQAGVSYTSCHPDGRRHWRPWRAPCPGGTDASNNNVGHQPSDNALRRKGSLSPLNRTRIRELQNQLEEMRSQMVTMQNRIATLEAAKGTAEVRSQPDETKTAAEPTAFHFKGLTLTPGGFLNSTALVRARNENADVATSLFCDSAGWIIQRELERASRNGAQFAAVALAPGFCRQHHVTGICRNRFPRSSPHRRTTCNPVPGLLA